jgi:MHS family proline/betaine transporter-like MFS transporter
METSSRSLPLPERTSKKIIDLRVLFASMAGNALEFYDFTLYGFFVAILAPLYFPSADPMVSLISGFGVFALGFFMRPLGAVLFGHIGDKYGRKIALSFSIFGIAIPTAAIGLLPTYEQIGIFAPLLLTFFRLIQGLCAGGEYNGAGLFVVEHGREGHKGFLGSLLTSSGSFGALLACIIGGIFVNSHLPQWSWRIPFLFGLVIGFVGYYLRSQVSETLSKNDLQGNKAPIAEVLKHYPLSLLICIFIGATATVPYYIILTFMNSSLMTLKIITPSEMMTMNAFMLSVCIITLPLMGWLSDKIGQKRLMLFSAGALLVFAYPFFMAYSTHNLYLIFIFQIVMLSLNEAFVGPSNAYMSELFPKRLRYTGIAFGYCLGLALFGGTAPYICASLIKITSNPISPALCIVYAACMGILAVLLRGKLKKKIAE